MSVSHATLGLVHLSAPLSQVDKRSRTLLRGNMQAWLKGSLELECCSTLSPVTFALRTDLLEGT